MLGVLCVNGCGLEVFVHVQLKALKSAKKKAKQTIREAARISTIQKARRTYW